MPRYDDIDPQDIDPDTGRPYPGYSSPALDTSFHDHEMDVDDEEEIVCEAVPGQPNHFRLNAAGLRAIARARAEEAGEPDGSCSDPRGHKWAYTGSAYGGDDERWHGEGRCYCEHCGADGDA